MFSAFGCLLSLPPGGRCDWSAEDLLSSPFWGLELTPTDLQELEAALRHCKAHGLELQVGIHT